jgi:hypothetical protein
MVNRGKVDISGTSDNANWILTKARRAEEQKIHDRLKQQESKENKSPNA